jgi:hypothetical protein
MARPPVRQRGSPRVRSPSAWAATRGRSSLLPPPQRRAARGACLQRVLRSVLTDTRKGGAPIARSALVLPRAPTAQNTVPVASPTAGRVARSAPAGDPRLQPLASGRRANQNDPSESTTGCQRKHRSSLAVAAMGPVRIVTAGPDEGVILTQRFRRGTTPPPPGCPLRSGGILRPSPLIP